MRGNKAIPTVLTFVLSLVLCAPAAGAFGSTGDVPAPATKSSIVLCGSTGTAGPVVRAKVDKTPFTVSLDVPDGPSLRLPVNTSAYDAGRASDRPGLVLSSPPLAARPPPLA